MIARAYARSLASAFKAHLTFASLVLELGAPNTTEMVSYDIFVSALESSKATKLAELEDVAGFARREDIGTETKVITAPLGTAWQAIADFARAFDLAIIEQSGGTLETDNNLEIEAATFGSGRPILVVPYIHRAPFKIERLIVAWDGSAGAARAVGDAMPLLASGAGLAAKDLLQSARQVGEAVENDEDSRRQIDGQAPHQRDNGLEAAGRGADCYDIRTGRSQDGHRALSL